MKKHWIYYVIIACVLLSCDNNKTMQDGLIRNTVSYNYELVGTDKILSYEVDNETEYRFSALFPYTDKSGKEYLTFQNTFFQILFYDLNNENFLFKIQLQREGPNGIPGPGGFYIEDFNNIFETCGATPFLYKIDTTGAVIQKIRYGLTNSGSQIIPQRSISFDYKPLVFIDSKLYLAQQPWQSNPLSKTPLCVVIDTVKQLSYELPCPFPSLIKDDELFTSPADATDFSRIFDGKEFVYSFFYDENIHVINIDHTKVRKYKIKSKYIDRIRMDNRPSDYYLYTKQLYGNATYGNLIYDQYRNIYYRIVNHNVELENGPNYGELYVHGHKKFSIMILDKNFNVIGETLFPEWVYCPSVLFVHRDGLYICNNHPMNPSFNEDILSFQCFEVRKIKKN